MKKWMIPAVLLLLLTGCVPKDQETIMDETVATALLEQRSEPTETTQPTPPAEPEWFTPLVNPKETDLVRVRDYIPGIVTELVYATADNFTGQVIYDFEDVFLRYGTVMKLKAVCAELETQGLTLKIWDGFRPVSAQFRLWEVCPDPTYVADPNVGFSNHSRGFAVDVTLVDSAGNMLEMPTEFDDFSGKADRDFSDCTETAAENARFLERVMENHGFSGYWGEWWHFNDTQRYEVETVFDPGLIRRMDVDAQTPLLEAVGGASILTIPRGEQVTFLGQTGGYALVEYWGYRGYIAPAN